MSLADQASARKDSQNEDMDNLMEEAGQEDLADLNAQIPESLHRRVKMQAVQQDTTIREEVIAALEAHLTD
jgi:hypothetical protein